MSKALPRLVPRTRIQSQHPKDYWKQAFKMNPKTRLSIWTQTIREKRIKQEVGQDFVSWNPIICELFCQNRNSADKELKIAHGTKSQHSSGPNIGENCPMDETWNVLLLLSSLSIMVTAKCTINATKFCCSKFFLSQTQMWSLNMVMFPRSKDPGMSGN